MFIYLFIYLLQKPNKNIIGEKKLESDFDDDSLLFSPVSLIILLLVILLNRSFIIFHFNSSDRIKLDEYRFETWKTNSPPKFYQP